MVRRIEALADAIARLNQAWTPEADAYQLRNPLLIKSFARPGKHETDDKGRRIFESFLSGYKASLFDLDLKLRGKSRAGLTTESTLENLLGVYGIDSIAATDNIVAFVRRALKDQSITKRTSVTFFVEKESSHA